VNVGAVSGICALSVGFAGKTGFTFKLTYGENMSEKVGRTDLNRYVLQVIICNINAQLTVLILQYF